MCLIKHRSQRAEIKSLGRVGYALTFQPFVILLHKLGSYIGETNLICLGKVLKT